MIFQGNVETNSVSLRIRKPYTDADLNTHTVLSDDVFAYVDFFFKTHKRIIKCPDGKKVKQNYSFYWDQARNFYKAAKVIPIESSPLPMYYCMLNAVKAYLLYKYHNVDILKEMSRHGLHEAGGQADEQIKKLENVTIKRDTKWIFPAFAKALDPDFDTLWKPDNDFSVKVKDLLYQLPFVHAAYSTTYGLPRNKEKFLPLKANCAPTFRREKNNRIRLAVDLDKNYFKESATRIPDSVANDLPDQFIVNPDDGFQLVSKESVKKKDITKFYKGFRKCFSYIKSEKRLWYIVLDGRDNGDIGSLNSMTVELALVHRFSEIVRYKPEQMTDLLNGKENWLIHEFLSIVLDQFMDEIACEITGKEIMPTRVK